MSMIKKIEYEPRTIEEILDSLDDHLYEIANHLERIAELERIVKRLDAIRARDWRRPGVCSCCRSKS
jgi:hypothetical protein